MKKLTMLFQAVLMIALIVSCSQESDPVPAAPEVDDALSSNGRPKTMIWADGLLFESVVAPAVFDGDKGNYDRLYAGSFLSGIGLISESKPGDQDYNGGRWDLFVLKEGVMTDYSLATSDQDLHLDDFQSAGRYFLCPLLPRKNR